MRPEHVESAPRTLTSAARIIPRELVEQARREADDRNRRTIADALSSLRFRESEVTLRRHQLGRALEALTLEELAP